MKTKTWRDDEYDRGPRFGSAARRWFYQSITRHAALEWRKIFPYRALDDEQCIALAKSLTPRAEEFVQWDPAEEFAGPGFAAGHWVIRWFAVCYAIEGELGMPGAPATPEELSQGLDKWLAEDIAGGATRMLGLIEPHMMDLLPRGTAGKACKQAHERRRRWPRLCVACGKEFRGDREKTQTCPKCIKAYHTARAARTSGRGAQ